MSSFSLSSSCIILNFHLVIIWSILLFQTSERKKDILKQLFKIKGFNTGNQVISSYLYVTQLTFWKETFSISERLADNLVHECNELKRYESLFYFFRRKIKEFSKHFYFH